MRIVTPREHTLVLAPALALVALLLLADACNDRPVSSIDQDTNALQAADAAAPGLAPDEANDDAASPDAALGDPGADTD